MTVVFSGTKCLIFRLSPCPYQLLIMHGILPNNPKIQEFARFLIDVPDLEVCPMLYYITKYGNVSVKQWQLGPVQNGSSWRSKTFSLINCNNIDTFLITAFFKFFYAGLLISILYLIILILYYTIQYTYYSIIISIWVYDIQSCTQIIRPLARFYSYDYDLRKRNNILKWLYFKEIER